MYVNQNDHNNIRRHYLFTVINTLLTHYCLSLYENNYFRADTVLTMFN